MDFAIFRLFIRVSLFVIALIACIIYLIKKRKLIYSIFFDKEAIKKEYTGKNDIIFLRLANTILVIVAILLILYLKDFVLDMPYICLLYTSCIGAFYTATETVHRCDIL